MLQVLKCLELASLFKERFSFMHVCPHADGSPWRAEERVGSSRAVMGCGEQTDEGFRSPLEEQPVL